MIFQCDFFLLGGSPLPLHGNKKATVQERTVAKKHTVWPLTAYKRTPKRYQIVMTNCNK
jgi:hypothetical protein